MLALIDIILKNFPDAYISPLRRSLAKAYLQQYASMKYLQATHILPVKDFYKYHGFEILNGELVYLSSSRDDCDCECCIPQIVESEIQDACQTGLRILDVGKRIIGENGEIDFVASNRVSAPFWLYLHFGFAVKLFEDTGKYNEFLMVLQGEKEVFKTALVTCFALPFNPDCIINFESTEAAINAVCEKSVDMIMVCDDIFKMSKDFKEKFEFINRTFGDGIGRAKTINQGKKVVKTRIRGGCIVTSEHILNQQMSSMIRCLHLFIEKISIDENVLKEFQVDNINALRNGESSKLQRYFAAWIQRVLYIYNNKLQDIIDFEDEETIKKANLSSRRYRRILNILIILLKNILDWYEEKKVISGDYRILLEASCKGIIVELMKKMMNLSMNWNLISNFFSLCNVV